MEHITAERFNELANIRSPHCISIFIPTHRAGKEVNEMIDQKHLKNSIKLVREELRGYQLKDQEIDKILQPAEKLLEDTGFWSLQSEGLALFLHAGFFEYYTLPVSFEPYIYISDHFYLKPLIPYLNDDGWFYLLALSLQDVRVYEGTPHRLTPLAIDELLPQRLEEIVGYDYQQKSLQFRSGQTDSGGAMFHGHGAPSEQAKKEISKFFRWVNDGLMEFLYDKKIPLILAAVEYLVPIYREANEYKHLHEHFIAGNPEHEQLVTLHKKAKALLKDHFDQEKKNKIRQFEEALASNRASFHDDAVVTAAINKRVDTLFIRQGEESWGIYDPETNQVIIRPQKNKQSAALLNMAAVHTLQNSGRVYIMEPEEMPEPNSKLNALLRF